jgi:hypothetical protein
MRLVDKKTYVIRHFVLCFDAFGPEEVLKWLLFLAIVRLAMQNTREFCCTIYSPIDVRELVLSHASLHSEGNVKRSTGCHGASDARHGH